MQSRGMDPPDLKPNSGLKGHAIGAPLILTSTSSTREALKIRMSVRKWQITSRHDPIRQHSPHILPQRKSGSTANDSLVPWLSASPR